MKVAVVGGTGVAGRCTVEALRAGGHEPLALSRSTGVDVAIGAGLGAALRGADAVIDATNVATLKAAAAEAFFGAAARNLTTAAEQAGVGHVVALSIIGIDRVPSGYYQGKLRQERVLAGSAVPVSILRAAQFHEFPGQYLERFKRGWVVVPTWRVQPVAAREVGAALAELATRPPVPMTELAGPQVETMADLVRRYAAATGQRRRVVEVRVPGGMGRAMARGGNLPDRPGLVGSQTFEDWLREQHPGQV